MLYISFVIWYTAMPDRPLCIGLNLHASLVYKLPEVAGDNISKCRLFTYKLATRRLFFNKDSCLASISIFFACLCFVPSGFPIGIENPPVGLGVGKLLPDVPVGLFAEREDPLELEYEGI